MDQYIQAKITTPDQFLDHSPRKDKELLYVIQDFNAGRLEKPPHQREEVWSEEQKRGWVDRLNSPLEPVGVIVTYQVRENPTRKWLNDGWQRLNASIDYLNNPQKYGHGRQHAENILGNRCVPIQHRIYANHQEALTDFQFLNLGTSLTTYEFFHGILTYQSNYDTTWRLLLDRLHVVLPAKGAVILSRDSIRVLSSKNRRTRHKHMRDDYALFLRYLLKDRQPLNYEDIGTDNPSSPTFQKHTPIERQLANHLKLIGYDKAKGEFDDFERFLIREIRFVQEIFKSVFGSENAGVTMTFLRWVLAVALWKSFQPGNITTKDWHDFLEKLLQRSYGTATVIDPDNPRKKTIIRLSQVGQLRAVCRIINSDLHWGAKPKENDLKLKPQEGFDISHVAPWDRTGDPHSFIEDSKTNRSRGAKSIAPEEDISL